MAPSPLCLALRLRESWRRPWFISAFPKNGLAGGPCSPTSWNILDPRETWEQKVWPFLVRKGLARDGQPSKNGKRGYSGSLFFNSLYKYLLPVGQMGLYFNGGAHDTCWGRGMFRVYVSRYVSGYVSGVCFGYVSRDHELLCLQLRGYVTGYVSRVCNPCALLKPEPPKKTHKAKCLNCRRGALNPKPFLQLGLRTSQILASRRFVFAQLCAGALLGQRMIN